MLVTSKTRMEAELPADALVLDVGGWASPLSRADHVLDLMPYATRGLYGDPPDPAAERFSDATWVQRDICDREPWPFADAQFEFAVCSHTLEDVRDPVFVCSELQRVARAGYVEVPSRRAEQTWGITGDEIAGWPHHHWMCEVDEGTPGIEFVFKHGVVHLDGFHHPRGATPADDVSCFWWETSFAYAERVFVGHEDLVRWLLADLPERGRRQRLWRKRT